MMKHMHAAQRNECARRTQPNEPRQTRRKSAQCRGSAGARAPQEECGRAALRTPIRDRNSDACEVSVCGVSSAGVHTFTEAAGASSSHQLYKHTKQRNRLTRTQNDAQRRAYAQNLCRSQPRAHEHTHTLTQHTHGRIHARRVPRTDRRRIFNAHMIFEAAPRYREVAPRGVFITQSD